MTNEYDDIVFLAQKIRGEKDPAKQLKVLKSLKLLLNSAIIRATVAATKKVK